MEPSANVFSTKSHDELDRILEQMRVVKPLFNSILITRPLWEAIQRQLKADDLAPSAPMEMLYGLAVEVCPSANVAITRAIELRLRGHSPMLVIE